VRRRLLSGVGAVVAGAALSVGGFASAAGAKQSALCRLDTAFTHGNDKTQSSIAAAIESGNWTAAQRTLLSAVHQEQRDESELIGVLHHAPAKVVAAGRTMIAFAGTEEQVIRTAASATQFETSEENAAENPKIESAERTLASYTSEKCGTPMPTSSALP
jgi:Spy/CpxP family protein refolding chaperone